MVMGGWFSQQVSTLPALLPWLLAAALAITALGFWRVVYFVSVGYTLSIIAMAVMAAVVLRANLDVLATVQIALLVAWGLRLGIYILGREAKTSYRSQLDGNQSYDRKVSWPKRIPIWLSVALLYVAMFAPALYPLADGAKQSTWAVAVRGLGALVMLGGVILEATADQQKAAAKQRAPGRFVDSGLYGWVRCPNYFGEILVWTGSLLMGLPFLTSVLRAVIALIGWVCIVLIMMGSTKRLERTQGARYGHLPEYQAYTQRVPVLLPWTSVYTLQGVKVYLE